MATTLFNTKYISGAYNNYGNWVANAYQFRVEVLLNSQDLVNNKSNVTCNFYIKGLNQFYYKGHSNTTAILMKKSSDASFITVASGSYNAMGKSGVEYKMLSYTGDIAHYPGGTMGVEFECTYSGSSGSNYLPRPQDRTTGSLTLPRILRQSIMTVTPSLLQKDGTMAIAITRYVNTYTMTVKYEVNGNTITLGTKSSTTSYSVPYSTIAGYLGSFTAAPIKITCDTYSGNTLIGSDVKTIMVQTGVVALSLYDDMEGETGVTIGQEAQSGGFNCYVDAAFSFDGLTINPAMKDYVIESGTSDGWTYQKWASGKAECWKTASFTITSKSAWTSGSGLYYTNVTPKLAYPVGLFAAMPLLMTSVTGPSGSSTLYVLAARDRGSASETDEYRLICSSSAASGTVNMNYHAIGRWQ